MKLTKGKIARLHKTNRQSVKKQKRNKKHRNVKNLMSLNQKQSAHLANKSMKKYKKVGEELVRYGGAKTLDANEIKEFQKQLDDLLTDIGEKSKEGYETLSNFEKKYYEGLVQIMNNKLYNVNTLKKVCSVDVKVNTFIITNDNLYVVVAMSDGRVVICDIHLNGAFINSYSHDDSVTALVVFPTNSQSNVIISGSTDGFIKRYTLGPLAAGKRPLTQTHQTQIEVESRIFSIVLSNDNTNILVTTVTKTEGGDENTIPFNMAIYSSAALELPPPPLPPPPLSPPTPRPVSNLSSRIPTSTIINPTMVFAKLVLSGWDLAANTYYNWKNPPPPATATAPPKEEPKHNLKFKVKYITLSDDKRLMAFCTNGRIHIQKLEDDAKPVMRAAVDDTGTVIPDKFEPDELVIDNKYLDEFTVACFSPNGTHIACGAGNILSVWQINMSLKAVTTGIITATQPSTYTLVYTSTLYSPITSILLNDDLSVIFCGFNDGSIQKNPHTISYPGINNYFWIGGHFDEIRNLYLVGNMLYSSSYDGTIREVDITVGNKILTSDLLITSAPELSDIYDGNNPFIDKTFRYAFAAGHSFDNTNADYLNNELDEYFDEEQPNIELHAFKTNAHKQANKMFTPLNTLDRILQINKTRTTESQQVTTALAIDLLFYQREVARIKAVREVKSEEKQDELRKLKDELQKKNIANTRKKEVILQNFQTNVNEATTSFSKTQKKRFKDLLTGYYGLFSTYVTQCITQVVTMFNNYIIELVNNGYEEADLLTSLLALKEKLLQIESEIRKRNKEAISGPFWNSLTTLENNDTVVILELKDSLPQFEKIKTVTSVLESSSYSNDEKKVYASIIKAYKELDDLNFKIRKYNLNFIKKGDFNTPDLKTTASDILTVLCQTDILSGKPFQDIMTFADNFGRNEEILLLDENGHEIPGPKELTNLSLKNIQDYKTFKDFEEIFKRNKASLDIFTVLPELELPTFFNFIKSKFIAVPTIRNETPLDKNTLYIRTFDTPKTSGVNSNEDAALQPSSEAEVVSQLNEDLTPNSEAVVSPSGSDAVLPKLDRVYYDNLFKHHLDDTLTIDVLKQLTGTIQTERQDSTYESWLKLLNGIKITTIGDLLNISDDVIASLPAERMSNLKSRKKGLAASIRQMRQNSTLLAYLTGKVPPLKKTQQTNNLPVANNETVKPEPASVQQVNGNTRYSSAPASVQQVNVTAASSAPRKNLSEADLGRATKVFIDELVHKIGPVLNNMPYGAQETTDAVSNVQRIIYGDSSKLLGQPSTSDDNRYTNLENRILSLEAKLNEKRKKRLEAGEDDNGEDDNDDDDEDYLEEDGDDDDDDSGDENGEGEGKNIKDNKAKKAVAPVTDGSEAAPVTVTGTDGSEAAPVTVTGTDGSKPAVAVSKDIPIIAEITNKNGRTFLKSLIEKFRLPWVSVLRSKVGLSSGGGQTKEEEQKGGASIDDVKDINEILNCYAKRLSNLAHDPTLKRTTAEINSGIVENWYHFQVPNQRKVYVDKVTTNSPDLTIDKLHQKDIESNGFAQVGNILYIRFILTPTTDYTIQQHRDNKEYNFVNVTGLDSGYLTNKNQTKEHVDLFISALKENLQKVPTITTIKFLVLDELIVLETVDGTQTYASKTYANSLTLGVTNKFNKDPEFKEISENFIGQLMTLVDFDLRA